MNAIKKLCVAICIVCISTLLSGCIALIPDFVNKVDELTEIIDRNINEEIVPSSNEIASNLTDDTLIDSDEEFEYSILPYFNPIELCYTGEIYHEADNICTLPITCETAIDCEIWGDQLIHEIINQYGGFDDFYGFFYYEYEEDGYEELSYENDGDIYNEQENHSFLSDYDEEIVATYMLEDFEILIDEDADGQYNTHTWIWDEFSWIIPSEQLWMLNSFTVFNDDELIAYVIQEEEDKERWNLGVNLSTSISYQDSISTHIHEFAHLLLLNSSQVDPYKSQLRCYADVFLEDQGCPKSDSYILEFVDRFGLDYEESSFEDDDDYYNDQVFVSDYASNNLLEDMAESFYIFVLTEKPTGSTIADQKVLMFYEYEELVFLRAEILSRVATYMYRVI